MAGTEIDKSTEVPLDRDTQPIDVSDDTCNGVGHVAENPVDTTEKVFPDGRWDFHCPELVDGKCLAALKVAPEIEDFPLLPDCPVLTKVSRKHTPDLVTFMSAGRTYSYSRPCKDNI